jgi:hypothetical protein
MSHFQDFAWHRHMPTRAHSPMPGLRTDISLNPYCSCVDPWGTPESGRQSSPGSKCNQPWGEWRYFAGGLALAALPSFPSELGDDRDSRLQLLSLILMLPAHQEPPNTGAATTTPHLPCFGCVNSSSSLISPGKTKHILGYAHMPNDSRPWPGRA